MAEDKIDITDERALSPKEVSFLVAEFLKEHPTEFSEWVDLERRGKGVDAIWEKAIDFLKRHSHFGKRTDLHKAALAMRVEFYRIAHQDKS